MPLTEINLSISAGIQRPVGKPNGERVASQWKSSSISAPCVVVEIRPRTKKHVLFQKSVHVAGERKDHLPSDRRDRRVFRYLKYSWDYLLLFTEAKASVSSTNIALVIT